MRTKPNCRPDSVLRAAALGLTLLAAACVAPEGASGPGDAQSPEDGVPATQAAPAGAAPNDVGAVRPGVQTVGTRRPNRYSPEEFVGFQPDALLPVLGAPDFVRRDGPAQIWQYRAENCVFDLFLYRDGGTSRVDHVELRERGASTESAEDCYMRMRKIRKPAG